MRDKMEARMVLVGSTGAMEKNMDVVIVRRLKQQGMSSTTQRFKTIYSN